MPKNVYKTYNIETLTNIVCPITHSCVVLINLCEFLMDYN